MQPITPELKKAVLNDPAVRIEIARRSHQLFFPIYLGHYMKYPSAQFHDELFRITEDEAIRNYVIVAFRNSAKSTIFTLSYPIWAILGQQQKKFILILGHTTQQAQMYMKSIKDELETNRLLRKDLGPFRDESDWQAASIVIPRYNARIMCASYQQGIRGMRHNQFRPDLIICDDVEDLESTQTKEGRDKVDQWLTGEVIPAGDQNTRLIVVGNLLHEDSLIMRLKQRIELNQFDGKFLAIPFSDDDGKLAWPGKFDSPNKVEAEKKNVGNEIAWQREFMLKIIPDEGQIVHPEWLQYYDQLPAFSKETDHRYTIMAVDLAISQKSSSDYTAIVSAEVYGRDENLRIYILPNPINKRLTYPETIELVKSHAVALGRGYQAQIIIEKVQYQEALIQDLDAQGFQVEPFVPHGNDKRMRLYLTTCRIRNGQILFPKAGVEELIQQLIGFGVEKHDDLVDAFVMLVLKVVEKDNNGGHFIFPRTDALPETKTKEELEKDADRLASLEQEIERGRFNEEMRETLRAFRGW
jgi:predicted phage terminase large subunit-like protein